jgi:hypothetical protein
MMKMTKATVRGMTTPSTIGRVVLLERLTGFSHAGLLSSGPQDLAENADEVVACCGPLWTILGA